MEGKTGGGGARAGGSGVGSVERWLIKVPGRVRKFMHSFQQLHCFVGHFACGNSPAHSDPPDDSCGIPAPPIIPMAPVSPAQPVPDDKLL